MLELFNPVLQYASTIGGAAVGSFIAMLVYDYKKRCDKKKRTQSILSKVFAHSESVAKKRLESIGKIKNLNLKTRQSQVDLSIYAIEIEPFVSVNLQSMDLLDPLKEDEISIIYEVSSEIKHFNKMISKIHDRLPNMTDGSILLSTGRYLSLFQFHYEELVRRFDRLDQIEWYDRTQKLQLRVNSARPFQESHRI